MIPQPIPLFGRQTSPVLRHQTLRLVASNGHSFHLTLSITRCGEELNCLFQINSLAGNVILDEPGTSLIIDPNWTVLLTTPEQNAWNKALREQLGLPPWENRLVLPAEALAQILATRSTLLAEAEPLMSRLRRSALVGVCVGGGFIGVCVGAHQVNHLEATRVVSESSAYVLRGLCLLTGTGLSIFGQTLYLRALDRQGDHSALLKGCLVNLTVIMGVLGLGSLVVGLSSLVVGLREPIIKWLGQPVGGSSLGLVLLISAAVITVAAALLYDQRHGWGQRVQRSH